MSTKIRRSYTDTFKAEAVRLVRDSGNPGRGIWGFQTICATTGERSSNMPRGVIRPGNHSGPSRESWPTFDVKMPS